MISLSKTLFVLLLTSLFCFPLWAKKAERAPTKVITKIVKLSEISNAVEALGTLKANESVEITATVVEKITAIHFDDGQRVEKDQILIEMTNDEEHAQLNEARATLEEARKQFNRFKKLTTTKAVSKSLLDLRRRDMKTAKARLKAIESRMSDRLIKAPFAGVVGLRNISVGALVQPGDVITTLHDDSVMKLDFSVPSTVISNIRKGLLIEAKARAYGDKAFNGSVKTIDSTADPITRSVQVRALLPNEDRLLIPGVLMSVELSKNPRSAITIAEEAIIMLGDKHFVYKVNEDSKVVKQVVSIGTRFRGKVEITSGLAENDEVITRGIISLREGQTIARLNDNQKN